MRESRETRQLKQAIERGERRFGVLAAYLRSLTHPVGRDEVRRVLSPQRRGQPLARQEITPAREFSEERLVEMFAYEFSQAVHRDVLCERAMRLAITAPDPRAACLREVMLLTVRWRFDSTKQYAIRGAEILMSTPDNLLLALRRFFEERDKYLFRRS